jgi:ABC-2 type transport system ATP-binding protein
MVIEVRELTKRYGDVVAVDGLSFDVGGGEVFGLLGPNGAGKTTAIRIIMDILQPDEGSVRVLGQPPGKAKDQVGYLPEERGLYRNLKVLDVLTYFGELKGLDRAIGRERAAALLSEVQLQDWGDRKVRDLSRGMQQKVQFIATLIHDPELLFLDEPFQGLDPVNVEQMRDFIARLHAQGKTIVLSTHQMGLVEALCDRILLVDHGQAVLYGPLEEIKRRYAPNAIRVRVDQLPPDLPGVQQVEPDNGAYRLTLAESAHARDVLRALLDRGADVRAFEVAPVPLEEIFVAVVTGRGR